MSLLSVQSRRTFIQAAANKPGFALVAPKEAATRVVVMEAMYRSAREKRWVSIA